MAYMYVLYHLFKKMFKAEQKYLFPSEVLVYRYTFDFVKTESINYRRQINCDLKRTEMIVSINIWREIGKTPTSSFQFPPIYTPTNSATKKLFPHKKIYFISNAKNQRLI